MHLLLTAQFIVITIVTICNVRQGHCKINCYKVTLQHFTGRSVKKKNCPDNYVNAQDV